ncbi:MAG: Gfo/Idh/MocA family oxidoreductase [Candidatus Omnitrophica bacterium]|nr:Gfo/Idh/MocA family oxidoreductase [Candidatus Omnitrophota bacterium]
MEVSRRKFIGSSTAAVVAAGTLASGKVFGANEKVSVCCIGIHGQGGSHIRDITEQEGGEVVALCDVDKNVLEERSAQLKEKTGKQAKLYGDLREVMEDDSIDAISIATPNHWHSLAAILGCQAGKDVYVEKPISHNIFEGRQLVNAAKKYNRVVQHGTQSRSNPTLMRDIQLMHEGFLGDIYMAKGFTYKTGNRHSIGHAEFKSPPDNLNWDLWQGPAERAKYCDNYVHYNWHWFWQYGNGEFGNQLVHEMDVGVWGLNGGVPIASSSTGGRYIWGDQGVTPNTQVTTFHYANGKTLLMEVRNLGSYKEAGLETTGNTFFGEKGYYVRDHGFFDYDGNPIKVDKELPYSPHKFYNFFKTVKSRNPADNPCDALVGHISAMHCHIGNTAYRLGRNVRFDPETERYIDDPEANETISREYEKGFEVTEITV